MNAQPKQAVLPATQGPAADELAWGLVKDTKDPAVLRRFVEQFPDSSKRAEAEKRAAMLVATPPRAPVAPKEPTRTKDGVDNSKCFTFQGRQFCE